MAKDPAMLWYWGDWYSGTSLMSRFLKGCYMDLLHAQFNHGRLSLEEIKTCLGADFGSTWSALQKKFKQDENGLFFNEKLEREKKKRADYSASRKKIREDAIERKKKAEATYVDTYVEHTTQRMENENENVFNSSINTLAIKKFTTMPTPENFNGLPEQYLHSSIELIFRIRRIKVSEEDINALWPVFKVQKLTGQNYYANEGKVYSHFLDWIKTKEFNSKPSTEQEKIKDKLSKIRVIEP